MNFDELFAQFKKTKIAIVGDVMLDTYWWGDVERISPEAPVPIVALDEKEYRMGGAANVALNTVSLGAETYLFSVIGEDEDGERLTNLLQQNNIDTKYIVKSSDRITTNKIRIVSRSQQMMRLDAEQTHDITEEDQTTLINNFQLFVKRYQPTAVIFEDYNKGVLTETIIQKFIAICQENNVVTTVDPKKKNFFAYKNVDVFKPNLKEAREALNFFATTVDEATMRNIHDQLFQSLQHKISLITLSEKGVFFQKSTQSKIIPSHVRNIADVSGAGDTVISVASITYALTKNITLAAAIANIAGGLVCEEVGTAAINPHKLLIECKALIEA